MTAPKKSHCLQIFFSDMRTHGVWPMLLQKQESGWRHLSKQEAGLQIRDVTRSLQTLGIGQRMHVAFYVSASLEAWVSEWGVLANRSVAVIIPRHFTGKELIETLKESRSSLVFVDTLAAAMAIARLPGVLPELRHVVCFEGSAQEKIPVLFWAGFLKLGEAQPDQLLEMVGAITAEDKAVLFHYRDDTGAQRALSYTHGQLVEHARKMDVLLAQEIVAESFAIEVRYKHEGSWRKAVHYPRDVKSDKHYIRNLDNVLAAVSWGHITGHIMGYYVPVLKTASVQLVENIAIMGLPDYHPQIIVGEAKYYDWMIGHVTKQIEKSGRLKSKMFMRMLALGKHKYESMGRLGPLQYVQNAVLRKLITRRVMKLLGGRLRLAIGVDDTTNYETKLFFHTFGIGYIELPQGLLGRE